MTTVTARLHRANPPQKRKLVVRVVKDHMAPMNTIATTAPISMAMRRVASRVCPLAMYHEASAAPMAMAAIRVSVPS